MNPFTFFSRKKTNDGKLDSSLLNSLLKAFSSSGNVITGKDATSFACIDRIASSFASLSGKFYSQVSKQEIEDYPLYGVLQNPNIDDGKYIFFYNSVKDYFDGNVYWFKSYDGEDLIALYRLSPSSVRVKRDLNNRKIFTVNGEEYTSDRIVHIPSVYGYNNLIGQSIFQECSGIFKASGDLDAFVNNSFNNGIGNRLVIDLTKAYPNITDKQKEQLKEQFLLSYSGIKNAGKPLIKTHQVEYSKIETDIKDNRAQQLIENRDFQEREIAKLFGIPLGLINGAKTDNIEALYTFFIENAIRPLATPFEQAINRMIPLKDRYTVYFEYSYNSLLKTSIQARIDAYVKEITNGILSVNEVRRKENMPESEAGDVLFVPANLLPLRQDVIESYMANSKKKMQELLNLENQHEKIGDDKQ
jgi:HK97 family phage portal protein